METYSESNMHSYTERPAVMGKFWATHLGDTLCTTPLPRLFRSRSSGPLYIHDHPMLRAAFSNNPYIAGFADGATLDLDHNAQGSGHILQRLQQGLQLPVQPIPKPEVYLDVSEKVWAETEKRGWPNGRPICVLSAGGITDRGNLERVNWEEVVRILSEDFTVIQPVLHEAPAIGTIAYRNLAIRQYMALVAVADCFVGGTSGGSHVAAAFDIPSLIVTWRSMLDHLRFPVSGLGITAAFLYPQHWFIAAEDIAPQSFREHHLRFLIREMSRHGKAGKPTAVSNHRHSACGFVPAIPRPASMIRNRLMRCPPTLGKCRRPEE